MNNTENRLVDAAIAYIIELLADGKITIEEVRTKLTSLMDKLEADNNTCPWCGS